MSLLMVMAPVGQILAHWPQKVHCTLSSPWWKAGDTTDRMPRPVKEYTLTPCTSEHTRTQRPHRMHLDGSRTMDGLFSSLGMGGRL